MIKKFSNIPVFIPHLGCPNDCVFCNQRLITGNIKEVTPDEVRCVIEEYLTYLKSRNAMIAFFGGSFTGIDVSLQKQYLSVAKEYLDSGKVCGIRLSTRPDYINEEILLMLREYGVTNIELGVQSMCDEVLNKSERGHSAKQSEAAAKLIKKYGFTLGLQMMPGLPGDSEERSLFTADEIIRLGADEARVYPTCVLKNTKLAKLYEDGEYKPLTVEKAVDISAKVYKKLTDAGVNVIRCGLQETDTIGGDIVAGGYHPAMGEMVKARIKRDELEMLLDGKRNCEFIFETDASLVSQYVGQNKSNVNYFKEKYNVDLIVKQK